MPAPHHSVFLHAGCPSCRPTNSVKALKADSIHVTSRKKNSSKKSVNDKTNGGQPLRLPLPVNGCRPPLTLLCKAQDAAYCYCCNVVCVCVCWTKPHEPLGHIIFRWDQTLKLQSQTKSSWLLWLLRHMKIFTHSLTYLQQQQQQPFNGRLFGTTRVGRYQKKHSPAHTHPGQRTSFIIFLHLQRSAASSLFSLHAWQSSQITSFQVLLLTRSYLKLEGYDTMFCGVRSWCLWSQT